MKHLWLFLITAQLLFVTAQAQELEPELPSPLKQAIIDHTVKIKVVVNGRTARGFGLIVADSGGLYYVITAAHTLKSGTATISSIKIRTSIANASYIEAKQFVINNTELAGRMSNTDLAILTVPSQNLPFSQNAVLQKNSATSLTNGEPLWVIGRNELFVASTLVHKFDRYDKHDVGTRMETNNAIAVATTRPIEGGQSGAPLTASTGVVGMVVQSSAQGGETPAIEIQFIKELYQQTGLPWQLTEYKPPRKPIPTKYILGGLGVVALAVLLSNTDSGGGSSEPDTTLLVPTP